MPILTFKGKKPRISRGSYIAKQAVVIGDVTIGAHSSVWFNSVLRGDYNSILIGEKTNIQDSCVLHTDPNYKLVLRDNVTVGHGAVLHGCQIDSDVLIGMNSTILNGVKIGSWSVVAAGSVIRQGTIIKGSSLIAGVPARVIGKIDDKLKEMIRESTISYLNLAKMYFEEKLLEKPS